MARHEPTSQHSMEVNLESNHLESILRTSGINLANSEHLESIKINQESIRNQSEAKTKGHLSKEISCGKSNRHQLTSLNGFELFHFFVYSSLNFCVVFFNFSISFLIIFCCCIHCQQVFNFIFISIV